MSAHSDALAVAAREYDAVLAAGRDALDEYETLQRELAAALAQAGGLSATGVAGAAYQLPGVGVKLGTHFPPNTHRPVNREGLRVEPTWPAIEAALRGGADVVRVKRGTLSGNGAGSSSKAVLQNLDRRGGVRPLVVPDEGYGSVKVASLALREVHGVVFLGFDAEGQGVMLANCHDTVWGWSEMDHPRVTAHQGKTSSGVYFYEWVSRETDVEGDDRARFVTAGSSAATLTDFGIVGFYAAPIYRPEGSGAHTDFLQVEAQTGGGPIANLLLRDGVTFGASNQTVQAAGMVGLNRLDNVQVIGGREGERRYPRPAGADLPQYTPVALNGAGSAQVSGDSVIVGSVRWNLDGAYSRTADWAVLDRDYREPTKAELVKAWSTL